MKQLPLICLLILGVLLPSIEALFLAPVAVGVALGAIFVAKGLFLGALLSQRRTHRQSYRSYGNNHYRPRYHYNTGYNYRYTRPNSVSYPLPDCSVHLLKYVSG